MMMTEKDLSLFVNAEYIFLVKCLTAIFGLSGTLVKVKGCLFDSWMLNTNCVAGCKLLFHSYGWYRTTDPEIFV